MLLAAGLVAIAMGLVLGLLGGGGSVLTVPLLVYVVGMPTKVAIVTSLVAVAATSAVGAYLQARRGNVRLQTALVFGVASMIGAYVGGRVAAYVPGTVLLIGFAALMITTGVLMLRGGKAPAQTRKSAKWWVLVADGIAVGAVTGLVGAGGGFLIVPALVVLVGLEMRVAIGTSLAIISLNAGTAFLGHRGHVAVDWSVVGVVIAAAAASLLVGVRIGAKLPQATLKRGFGAFVIAMAAFILYREGALEAAVSYVGLEGALLVSMLALTAMAAVLAVRARHAHSPR